MHHYKDLNVWKLSREFASDIYKITNTFPDTEKFGLTSQLRRASISIASNLAEGASRSSNKDFSRFLEIALGSAYEIETQLLIATDLKYIDTKTSETLLDNINLIIKMLSKLRSNILKR